jgi:hypothetical protein
MASEAERRGIKEDPRKCLLIYDPISANFIRTIWGSIYPEIRSYINLVRFLSGNRIRLNILQIFAFFAIEIVYSACYKLLQHPGSRKLKPSTLICSILLILQDSIRNGSGARPLREFFQSGNNNSHLALKFGKHLENLPRNSNPIVSSIRCTM